jgi:hypothetical protein
MTTRDQLKTLWEAHHSKNPNMIMLGKNLVKVQNLMRKSAINGQSVFYVTIDDDCVNLVILSIQQQLEGVAIGRVADPAMKSPNYSRKTRLKVSMEAILK